MRKESGPAKRILVTAGATIEPLDPVRFISNFSTGMLGYLIAEACKNKGYKVCLVTGPVHLPRPDGIDIVKVETAREMEKKVFEKIEKCDGIIMTAAVCDFRPRLKMGKKIKKRPFFTLKLVKNPDILEKIARRKGLVKIGFSLESDNAVKNSEKKLNKKSLDLVVINAKTKKKDPFGPGKKDFMLLYKDRKIERFKAISKRRMAGIIADRLGKLLCGEL